jgi:ferrochelatase
LKWTKIQGELLVDVLNKKCPDQGPFKYYVGFRYTDPLTEEAVDQIRKDGVKRVVVFSQYPQYSCSTTGSSINRLAQLWPAAELKQNNVELSFIDRWSTNQGLIDAFADNIRKELMHFTPEERSKVVLLFSAHSLPLCVSGDPFEIALL